MTFLPPSEKKRYIAEIKRLKKRVNFLIASKNCKIGYDRITMDKEVWLSYSEKNIKIHSDYQAVCHEYEKCWLHLKWIQNNRPVFEVEPFANRPYIGMSFKPSGKFIKE